MLVLCGYYECVANVCEVVRTGAQERGHNHRLGGQTPVGQACPGNRQLLLLCVEEKAGPEEKGGEGLRNVLYSWRRNVTLSSHIHHLVLFLINSLSLSLSLTLSNPPYLPPSLPLPLPLSLPRPLPLPLCLSLTRTHIHLARALARLLARARSLCLESHAIMMIVSFQGVVCESCVWPSFPTPTLSLWNRRHFCVAAAVVLLFCGDQLLACLPWYVRATRRSFSGQEVTSRSSCCRFAMFCLSSILAALATFLSRTTISQFLWRVDLPCNVSTRKAPRRIHAGHRRPGRRCHQGSPRSLLQCRQGRTRGWSCVRDLPRLCSGV